MVIGYFPIMFFNLPELQLFLQVLLAAFLGCLIGLEREYTRREAGLKTFSLVALGACFFTAIAFYISTHASFWGVSTQIDPARVIQAVAIGIGFIGSGLIIQYKAQVEGLTTAAALWATAAIGIGVGVGLYLLSIAGTLLTILILAGFRFVEKRLFNKKT